MLSSVQMTAQANALLDHFRTLYRQKYAVEPYLPDSARACTIFKDLVRHLGESRARALLEFYFSQNGDNGWYKRNGHNLEVFSRSIDALSAQLGLKEKDSEVRQTRGPKLRVRTGCKNPKCRQFVDVEAYDLEEAAYSQYCPRCASMAI